MSTRLIQPDRPATGAPVQAVSARSVDRLVRRSSKRIGLCGLLASGCFHGGAIVLLATVSLAALASLIPSCSQTPVLVHLENGRASPAMQLSFAGAAQPESETLQKQATEDVLIEFEIPNRQRVAAEVGSPEPNVQPLSRRIKPVEVARVKIAAADAPPSFQLVLPQLAERPAVSLGEKLQPEPGSRTPAVSKSQAQREFNEAAKAESAPSVPSPASAESRGAEVDTLPRQVYNPAPQYPRAALLAGQSGRVVLRVLVGADGTPQRVRVYRSSNIESLDQAALQVVRRWRFQPAQKDGVAVATEVAVPIRFRLER